MKKSILSLLTVGLLATTFVGCKKDTNDESIPAPVFAITNGDATITTGASATIAGTVSAANSVNLKTFKVTTPSGNGGVTSLYDTTFTKATTSFPFSKVLVGLTAGAHVYTLTATDNNSQSSTATVTITVKAPGEIVRYTAKLLGAQNNNSTGSFFATSNGMIYKQAEAKTNSNLIDFVYYDNGGFSVSGVLAAPSDTSAQARYSGNVNAISGWTYKNATLFSAYSVMTKDQFETATDDRYIDGATKKPTSKANYLFKAPDNIYGFTTAQGKKGEFRVTDMNAGVNGDITIEVIVQK